MKKSFELMHKGTDGEKISPTQWKQAFMRDGIVRRSVRACTIYPHISQLPYANKEIVAIGHSCLPPGGK